MANKFHIDINGNPAPCTAELRECPRGNSDQHFDTMVEAAIFYEKINSGNIIPLNYKDKEIFDKISEYDSELDILIRKRSYYDKDNLSYSNDEVQFNHLNEQINFLKAKKLVALEDVNEVNRYFSFSDESIENISNIASYQSYMRNPYNKVKELLKQYPTDAQEIGERAEKLINTYGWIPLAVDPETCGCTECIMNEYIPYNGRDKDLKFFVEKGVISDNTY